MQMKSINLLVPLFAVLSIALFSGCPQQTAEQSPGLPESAEPFAAPSATSEPVVAPKELSLEEKFKRRSEEPLNPDEPLYNVPGITAENTLQKMVREYQNAETYGDHGQLVLELEGGATLVYPCTFAFNTPNFLRMEVGSGQLVSDGRNLLAQIVPLYGQILQLPISQRVSVETVYPDLLLARSMDLAIPPQIFWVPPQVILLFAKDPLKTLVPAGSEVVLLQPDWLRGHPCDRIEVETNGGGEGKGGKRVLWIDRDSFELRRIDLPTDHLPPQGDKKVVHLQIDFLDAALNLSIDPNAFQMIGPENALIRSQLTPWPFLLLGKPLENFETQTIKSLNNQDIALSQYGDRTIVLLFWSTQSPYCPDALKEMNTAYQQLKDDSQVRFISVCVDDEQVSNDDISGKLTEWGTLLPTCRNELELRESLHVDSFPSLVLLGSGGIVAKIFPPGLVSSAEMIEAINEVREKPVDVQSLEQQLEEEQTKFRQMVKEFVDKDFYAIPEGAEQGVPAEIIAREMPKKLVLKERFVLNDLKGPGNILVVPPSPGLDEPTFIVPYEHHSLAMFDSQGNLLRHFTPDWTGPDDVITFVRTALTADGKRVFLASALSGNRVFLLNDQLEPILVFPPKPDEAEMLMITDARLGDLDGDQDPELVLSVLNVTPPENQGLTPYSAAILALKRDGSEVWRNTNIADPYQVGIAQTDEKVTVLAMNSKDEESVLFEFDNRGNRIREIALKDGNPIGWFVVDELSGKGVSTICVKVPERSKKDDIHLAVINRSGEQDWKYPIQAANHYVPIESMIAADLVGDSTKEWIFASGDGVLHFLDSTGKPIDLYAHGKQLTGYAGATSGSRRLLLVADPESITVYEVQPVEATVR